MTIHYKPEDYIGGRGSGKRALTGCIFCKRLYLVTVVKQLKHLKICKGTDFRHQGLKFGRAPYRTY